MRVVTGAPASDGATAVFAVLIVVETLGIVAFAQGWIGGAAILAGHAVCLAGVGAGVRATFRAAPGADRTFAILSLLLSGCAGPLGAAGVVVMRAVLARTHICAHELDDWYRRLAGVAKAEASVALHDRIQDGRARQPTRGVVDHFPTVLQGDLARQQALLGLIGLAYHPDYRPILSQALSSVEPSIRVHAAAVSVKLRARALSELKRIKDAIGTGAEGEWNAQAQCLLDHADGGFLDEGTAHAAREDALALCRRSRERRPNDAETSRLMRRALVALERWSEAGAQIEEAEPVQNLRDLRVRARCLMQGGEARALHALLVHRSARRRAMPGDRSPLDPCHAV